MDRVALAESIAARWNEGAVVYAVAHGIDDYPARLGRDLDVVVDARDVSRAVAMAREVLDARGLAVASPPPLWGERLVAADRDAPAELLEIHTLTRITWRNTALVERPEPSARVGPFAVDPWVSVAKRIVLPLLAGNTPLFAADPRRLTLDEAERRAAARGLATLAGPELGARLLAAVTAADRDAIESLAPRFRRAVLRRSATMHPLRAAGLLWHTLARRLAQPLHPCAPIVAVVGASGADARGLLHAIAEGDRSIFTGLLLRPRSPQGIGLARALRDRVDSSRQRLVLYDVTPNGRPDEAAAGRARRWHIRSRPDLVLAIGDRAALGHADQSAGGPTVAVLPAGMEIDELRARAVALIIRAFIAKNQRGAPPPGG